MSCIEWDEEFELGISQLDEHHRRLIDILNSTYDCYQNDNHEEALVNILEELLNYTQYHFSAEEQLMQDSNYPARREHTMEHDMFTRQIAQFQQDLVDGKGLLAMEMIQFLGTWLLHHIIDVDKKFGIYLAAREASCPRQ